MPRPHRVEFPDALYHVTARGVRQEAIVLDDRDRIRWTDYLKEAVSRFGLELYAYALMDNHYHLFVAAPRANLGAAMQYLDGAHAMYFNTRHERSGHLFERRYRAILVESQGHYTEISRYIHLNPVRAGLVEWPEQYLWSSYYGYHSPRHPLSWLNYERVLAEFGEGKIARERYRQFVADGVGKKLAPPWLHAIGGWILGGPKFAAKAYALLAKESEGDRWDSRAASGKSTLDASLDDIAAAVCAHFNITAEQLKERTVSYRGARALFAFIARTGAGYSVKTVGQRIGADAQGSVSHLVRRVGERIAEDTQFARQVAHLEKTISPKGV